MVLRTLMNKDILKFIRYSVISNFRTVRQLYLPTGHHESNLCQKEKGFLGVKFRIYLDPRGLLKQPLYKISQHGYIRYTVGLKANW